MKLRVLLAGLVLALAGVQSAFGHSEIYAAPLTGAAEIPPNASPGAGAAFITVDFDLTTMKVEALFFNLTGNVTAAHIHCCTMTPGAANVGVATQTPSFTAFPSGGTFGSYERTFNMADASSYNAAFVTAQGGVSQAFNALVAGMQSGNAYFNIHTNLFPGGEIRGLLLPVPEPGTYAMMLVGLAVLGWVGVRRRKL